MGAGHCTRSRTPLDTYCIPDLLRKKERNKHKQWDWERLQKPIGKKLCQCPSFL